MNDPFDCNPFFVESSAGDLVKAYRDLGITTLISPESEDPRLPRGRLRKKGLKTKYAVNYANVKRVMPAMRSVPARLRGEARIICLSETWDNPLMWAHYADSHRGIVLGYDFLEEYVHIAEDDPPLAIEYDEARPKISMADLLCWFHSENLNEEQKLQADAAFSAYVLRKPKDWAYEMEWRIQKRWQGVDRYSSVPCLKLAEVLVGARVSDCHLDKIKEILNGRVRILRCDLEDRSYQLTRTEIA